MTKQRKRLIIILAAVLAIAIAVFLVIRLLPSQTPPPDSMVIAEGQTEFTITLAINEDTAYAGVEYAITLSDEDAVTFASFTATPTGAIPSPFLTKDGKHYFGYYGASNMFEAGEQEAGILQFTGYTGDQPLTITVVEMKVTRLSDTNESVTTDKPSPVFTYEVHR